MRLIDTDALGIGKAKREVFNNPEYADGWNSAIDIINAAPTVDAVEVVRCGECAYRRRCMLQHFVESNAVDGTKIDWSEWYCADGERKTE